MCGICGFIKIGQRANQEDGQIIKKMNDVLFHRGPDAQDTLVTENLAFGFTRLSIIGLDNGMQPIYNEDESLLLICNGEIFNYIELREELKKKGHTFRTATDVEVIVHLYEEYGTEFLNKLNGQFAFALFDRRKRQLLCARDHFGVIPLFYTFVDGTFIFASEVKAILEHPAVPREVDRVGLDQVFTFAGLVSPRTLFAGIHSLENGHYLLLDDAGNLKTTEYWDLVFPEGPQELDGTPENQYLDKVTELFERSINFRLRSDVPLGIYLSGGLDSSTIAMKLHQMAPNTYKEAFSIDFIDSTHSESIYQDMVAEAGGFRLNKKTFMFSDITERLQASVYHSECPIKETYNTASMSLSEKVRNNGIKVILSGEGADEFFAGYVGYRFDKMRQLQLIQNEATTAERELREKLWGDPDFYYERNFLEFDQEKKALYSQAMREAFDQVNCLNHFVIDPSKVANRNILNKRAYIDYKIRLVDHLVSDHGDRMAMANSVEARYPFLDKDLVEYAATLPTEMRLNDFTEKYIIRQMASRVVPQRVLDREKFHFIAPGSPYLLQKNVEYINDLLSYDLIKRQGFFDPDAVEALKNRYSQPGFTVNAPYETDVLITVITFGILLDTFFEGSTTKKHDYKTQAVAPLSE